MRLLFVHIFVIVAVESFHVSIYGNRKFQSTRRAYEVESEQSNEVDTQQKQLRTFEEMFFDEAELDADCEQVYPRGIPASEGYHVTRYFSVPSDGFGCLESISNGRITSDLVDRLGLSPDNVTVPVALMLLDPESYPTQSRSRKSCRKGTVIVNRGPLILDEASGEVEFNQTACFQGRAIHRVYPGDVIGIQKRMHGGLYPGLETTKPPFDLPIVYEDNHFAIVNKPAGIIVYTIENGGDGPMSIRRALPFVLKPPQRGTQGILKRPQLIHRLDRPTSGLLVAGKTRSAVVNLARQFEDRLVNKTYTAILNGIPKEDDEPHCMKDEMEGDTKKWNLIDHDLEDKNAVTFWRIVKQVSSFKAKEGYLSVVEMMPKTGRTHQLRRHMAWTKDTPIVGDPDYGGGDALQLRGYGLFLCSNKLIVNHPYYNTVEGRSEWEKLPENSKWADGMLQLSEDGSTVQVHATIDIANKFTSFLRKIEAQQRYSGIGDEAN